MESVQKARATLGGLGSEEHARMREAFALFDKDGSGTIDKEELGALLHSLGHYPSAWELAELMAVMDADGSGTIDFGEFVRCMGEEEESAALEEELRELQAVFTLFDHDGSGTIDARELRRALKILGVDLTAEEAAFLVADIDVNGDGEVSYEEFLAYILQFDDEGRRVGVAAPPDSGAEVGDQVGGQAGPEAV